MAENRWIAAGAGENFKLRDLAGEPAPIANAEVKR